MAIIIDGTNGITNVNGTAAAPANTGTDTDTGIFYGTNTLSFSTNGTTAVTVDPSQNVGIGTSSPSYKLDLNSGSNAFGIRLITTNTNALQIYADSGTTGLGPFIGSAGNNLTFGRAGVAEYARIDSSGNLLVGTTSGAVLGAERLSVFSTSFSMGLKTSGTTSSGIWVNSGSAGTANAGTFFTFYCNSAGTNTGGITTTGTITAYNVSSDYRLKENIVPLTGSLEKIAQLKPSLYNYKSDPTTNIEGFIAHELQEVVPHAVTGEKDAVDADGKPVYQGVDASFLIPHLVKAIQEQQALITQLQADVAALKGKIG